MIFSNVLRLLLGRRKSGHPWRRPDSSLGCLLASEQPMLGEAQKPSEFDGTFVTARNHRSIPKRPSVPIERRKRVGDTPTHCRKARLNELNSE